MKVKENPSLILAFHGMLGRKKQTSLLLLLLTLVFSFLTAAVIYSVSSAQVLQDTRCELYGEWQYLRLSDTDCGCRTGTRRLCLHPHRSAQ